MTDRIFSPSFGNRPQIFVGRDEVMTGLLHGLGEMPGSRERAVLILGQRGYGKTVLLLELADRAAQNGYLVASPTVVATGMLGRILEKIQEVGQPWLTKEKRSLMGGSIGVLGFSAGVQFQGASQNIPSFAKQLSDLCEELNRSGKKLLIMVDELVSNHEELRQLIIAYQEMVGKGQDISLIMAGVPAAVNATLQDHVLTFLNRARKINLGPLRINEIDSYYQQAFQKLGIHISEELSRKAAEDSKGSPYLMQLIGHYLTVAANPGDELAEEDLLTAVRRAEEDYRNDICQTSLSPLSEKDIDFLKAMAAGEGEIAKTSDIQTMLCVSPEYVQTYKRRLLQTGLIEAAGRGQLRFSVPYIREYLRESFS